MFHESGREGDLQTSCRGKLSLLLPNVPQEGVQKWSKWGIASNELRDQNYYLQLEHFQGR
jgi:hypothetical protein